MSDVSRAFQHSNDMSLKTSLGECQVNTIFGWLLCALIRLSQLKLTRPNAIFTFLHFPQIL